MDHAARNETSITMCLRPDLVDLEQLSEQVSERIAAVFQEQIDQEEYTEALRYYLSLVGKALQWAAGREPRVEWSGLPRDGQEYSVGDWPAVGVPVRFAWYGTDGQDATVNGTIRDAAGQLIGKEHIGKFGPPISLESTISMVKL